MQPITDSGRARLFSPCRSGVFYGQQQAYASLQVTIFSGMDLAFRVMKFAHVFNIAMIPKRPTKPDRADKATLVIRPAFERLLCSFRERPL